MYSIAHITQPYFVSKLTADNLSAAEKAQRSALTPIGDGVYKFTPEDPVKVTIQSCTVEVPE